MTGYNLPPGVEVGDLPGNGPAYCDDCEEYVRDDDLKICLVCENQLCQDCFEVHLERHDEEQEEEENVEAE